MPLINCQCTRPGFQRLSWDSLLRRTHFLILTGHGLRKRLWVLDSVEDNPPSQIDQTLEDKLSELFLLALKILLMAYHRSTLGRAITGLRIRWYRTKLNPYLRAK